MVAPRSPRPSPQHPLPGAVPHIRAQALALEAGLLEPELTSGAALVEYPAQPLLHQRPERRALGRGNLLRLFREGIGNVDRRLHMGTHNSTPVPM